uniref:Uncharacterized protein n=1 Tax=Anguilla anguilla TaxID=7936 RepID=A0A0E9RSS4_ANGAN
MDCPLLCTPTVPGQPFLGHRVENPLHPPLWQFRR